MIREAMFLEETVKEELYRKLENNAYFATPDSILFSLLGKLLDAF